MVNPPTTLKMRLPILNNSTVDVTPNKTGYLAVLKETFYFSLNSRLVTR